jgi:predicted DCC family thiol-disulfide oxidoreductase YuxK
VPSHTQIIYDADCGICTAAATWLRRRDRHHRLACIPSRDCTWDDAAEQPFATTVVARTADGHTDTASNAVAVALRDLGGAWGLLGRWVLFLNRLPLLHRYHDRCYYAVARRRHALSSALVRVGLLDRSCLVR